MGTVTYNDLYTLVRQEINKRTDFNKIPTYDEQLTQRGVTTTIYRDTFADISASELVQAIQDILNEALPSTILEGLSVEATSPETSSVIVRAGKGSAGGKIYTLDEDTTITIPFNSYSRTFYIHIYADRVAIDYAPITGKLLIAKVVVPDPGLTARVIDTKDGSPDAYIMNQKEYKLYGDVNGKFEEDTVELLRNNMNPLLASTLFGTITVSETLKIQNTQGTLSLDSDKLLLKNFNGETLAKFNQNGVYFYNTSGQELAKFSTSGAKIGNIVVTTTSIESGNYVAGSTGFKLGDDGNVEINNLTVRGIIYATGGEIGGWTIASDSLYATTTGTIKTSANVGTGYNGVLLDKNGIKVYDSILGVVVNLPSDGSAPTFSSGVIEEVTFEVSTNAVIRTSETVGDGTVSSAGILINSTGLYGCEASQTLSNANFKILASGNVYLKGEINATSGVIGGFTISSGQLEGGTIIGALIRGATIETSDTMPRTRMDADGVYYQVAPSAGKYGQLVYGGESGGVAPHYGTGILAYLYNEDYPILAILAEHAKADIRLYNRGDDPGSGTGPHVIGDIICVNGQLKMCTVAGSPGTFTAAGVSTFLGLSDTPNSFSGNSLKVVRVNSGETSLEFTTFSSTSIQDTDTDTKIQTEESADEDKIRFDIAGTEQIRLEDGLWLPTTDNDIDLGSSSFEFKNLYLDGVAWIDGFGESLISDTDDTDDLGSSDIQWKDLYIDGLAYIDQLGENLDCNDKQLTNLILENRTDDTGMTVTGQIWFRTDV